MTARIVAHHPNRAAIQRAVLKAIRARSGDEQYHLFFGEPRISLVDSLARAGSQQPPVQKPPLRGERL
jgi:hypothetical protein